MTCSPMIIIAGTLAGSLAGVLLGGWVYPKALDWRDDSRRARNRAAIMAAIEREFAPPVMAEHMADDDGTFREWQILKEQPIWQKN